MVEKEKPTEMYCATGKDKISLLSSVSRLALGLPCPLFNRYWKHLATG